MSDMGLGRPVDALDMVCKTYKNCQKCVRDKFGDDCIGEFVRYKYGEKQGDKFCKDAPNTCDRALCECDLAFAKAHVSKIEHFNTDYHQFWSTLPERWVPEDKCQRGSGPYEPECCGVPTGPYVLFNGLNQQCCADGTVGKIGDQCS